MDVESMMWGPDDKGNTTGATLEVQQGLHTVPPGEEGSLMSNAGGELELYNDFLTSFDPK